MSDKLKELKETFTYALDMLRKIEEPSNLKIFLNTAPFKSMNDTYGHLVDGLFITKPAEEIAAFFGLPLFVAEDLQAGALAGAAQRATDRGILPSDGLRDVLKSVFERKNKEGEEGSDPISEAIAAALKEKGVDAKVRTETIELPAALGKIFMEALAKKRAARGEPIGCQDPACSTCQVGNAMKAAHENGDISVEEILLFSSEANRDERIERMGEQIIAGRPALDVIKENAEELRRAASH